MANSNSKKNQSSKEDKTIEAEGVVVATHPNMKYTVEIDFQGLKHEVKCYVSGKMKKYFIEIKKGDKVRVEISLYDIDNGIITRRLTERERYGGVHS
jgi:translation initiation factor IF-1